ncbi:MAG: valine--tRNA ligase, partial [Bacteroidetes bacterium]
MSLPKHYSPQETEPRWYQHWLDQDYFHSEPDEREPYTIVIPPPNVTGVLHMGHMLNNTIQDILIRKARLEGKNACWVPGTDHASIATEAKVVRRLREQGIKKSDLTREQFLEHAWAWTEEFGGIILQQLQRLGASCDWKRTRFTMEESLSKAVLKVFVDLYKKGKLYRSERMTNWDPEALTVLSNEEVIYSEENSRLYHVRYQVEGSDEYITIATQRPETIMADTGLAVHPDDPRYSHLHGKRVIVPLVNRSVPIITDRYVDMDFGTGALKITPAHDPNDYEIGQRYGLEVIDIINLDGTLNDKAQFCVGMDRDEARKAIGKLLEEAGALVKIEDYRTRVGRSERTHAVVEPKLTLQWFVKMEEFAATALEAVRSNEVKFHPKSMWNMFHSWLKEENVRDWCISRQLWWGHRIPAWYYGEEVFVAETAEEALAQAREKTGKPDLSLSDLQQDEDVLDTWFSSWLWPISVFDGFERQDELHYYYPTNTLVTGWDIMFFWVARMIMAGYEWSEELLGKEVVEQKGRQPFYDVYFTGMVRDNKRRKMSKSLGNSPDALQLIEKYGADGMRFGILSSSSAGNDIIFDAPIAKDGTVLNESKLCEQGRNFCNKMWNALRLIDGWQVAADREADAISSLAADWIEARLAEVTQEVDRLIGEFRFSDAIMSLYKFIWGDFCSWYLEMIKPGDGQIDPLTLERTRSAYERMMTLLHPFMPFVSETIWHGLREREPGDDCCVSRWPEAQDFDQDLIRLVDLAQGAVVKIRETRSSKSIKEREPLALYVAAGSPGAELVQHAGIRAAVAKMAYLSDFTLSDTAPANAVSFLVGTSEFFLQLNEEIDTAAELAKLSKEEARLEGFIAGIEKKLSNERFVQNAPPAIVEKERQKLADGQAKLEN